MTDQTKKNRRSGNTIWIMASGCHTVDELLGSSQGCPEA